MTVEFTLDTTVALSRSGSVDLQSFSGDITVVAWDRDEVKIHAKSRNEHPLRFVAVSRLARGKSRATTKTT